MCARARNIGINDKRKIVDEQVQWLIILQHVIGSRSVLMCSHFVDDETLRMCILGLLCSLMYIVPLTLCMCIVSVDLNTIYAILQFFHQLRVVCQGWTSQVSWHQLLCMEMYIMLLWDRLMRSPSKHRSQTTGPNDVLCYIFVFHSLSAS